MMTARSGSKRRACSSTCMPPTPFMLRSVMTTWKLPVSICRSASSPLAAVSTWYPSLASSPFSASSIAFSSSTTRMRPCISAPRRHRQRDLELGPAADLARHLDRALVRLDDLLRDRHAEPGAVLLGGEERVEDAVELLGRDARAVVAQADGGEPVAVLQEEVDAPAFRDGCERVDRVVEDVGEHLPELLGVGLNGGAGDVVARDRHLGRVELRAQLRQRRVDDVREIDQREAIVLLLGELEEVRDPVLDTLELIERDLGVLDVLDRGRILAHLLDKALRRGDR